MKVWCDVGMFRELRDNGNSDYKMPESSKKIMKKGVEKQFKSSKVTVSELGSALATRMDSK